LRHLIKKTTDVMQPVSHNGALNGKVSDDVSENKGLLHER